MPKRDSGREPDASGAAGEAPEVREARERLLRDKAKALDYLLDYSGSSVESHRLLMLVDLQGIYLAFHAWLDREEVPIDDGLVIGRFALLQIERAAKEVGIRLASSRSEPTLDLRQLVEAIEIEYIDGRPHLAGGPDLLKNGTYLDVAMTFEMFYAPVPLDRIEWDLRRAARAGNAEARDQLRKAQSGVIRRKNVFERDYRAYADFVDYLKASTSHARSQEGFFGFFVGPEGLRNFDEKEVDIRIAIRAMDALHGGEADSICIVSSDQDFMPLHARADDFGIPSFHADLSKFMEGDRTGGRFKRLGYRFIHGGVEPEWPLVVLTEAMSWPTKGHFAKHRLSEREIKALCDLHNTMNEVKVAVDVQADGNGTIRMYRPG